VKRLDGRDSVGQARFVESLFGGASIAFGRLAAFIVANQLSQHNRVMLSVID
jgi:acyl-CoA hydrolase